MKQDFEPDKSWYHFILQKKYGTEKAIQLIKQSEYTIHRSLIRNEKKCKMCGKNFYTRSGGKINCGNIDVIGTCSYKFNIEKKPKKKTKLEIILKQRPWLKV